MISLHNKTFELFIDETTIQNKVNEIALQLNAESFIEPPLFIAILNGSFIFASDLLKKIKFDCEIEFIKVSSYENTSSTGNVVSLIGLTKNITNREIIIIEDIIDTGLTMSKIMEQLLLDRPKSIKVVTLLYKPDALQKEIDIYDYGFAIENRFVVGYGLDFDGLGRNLPAIYVH
jgi:hypoxanthine phosphoribosyltransferase